jgi:hypothetical protein
VGRVAQLGEGNVLRVLDGWAQELDPVCCRECG